MPPITDPNVLAQIQAQQTQGSTLASPPQLPPYYAPTDVPQGAPLINPMRQASQNAEVARLHLEQEAAARAAAKDPALQRKEGAEATSAELAAKEAQDKWDKEHPKPGPNTGVYGPDALNDLGAGDKEIVKGLVQGRIQPPSNFALKTPYWQNIIQHAAQLDPAFDMTLYPRRRAAFTTFMAGPDGRTMDRVNQALQHMERFANSAKALNNYKSGFFATPLNAGHIGLMDWEKDPKIAGFRTDRDALATELAAAFKGGNDPALASLDHWKGVLGAANSPEAFDKILQEATGLLGGRIDASTYRFKQAVGVNGDAIDLMSPKAREIYQRYSNGDTPFKAPADAGEKQLSTDTSSTNFPEPAQQEHAAFIAAHKGNLTPEQYIEFRKQLDAKYHTGEGDISPEDAKGFVDKVNKGFPSTKIPPMEKKLDPFDQARAAVAESAPGVAVVDATNAGTGGLIDLLAGQDIREKKDLADKEHPLAALTGELTGSIYGMGKLETGMTALARKLGVKPETLAILLNGEKRAGLAKDLGVNMTYGAARGFNGANNGEGLSGAAEGAGGGALGTGAGTVLTKGVTPLLSGKTLDALQQLKGVKLTTLQKLGLGQGEAGLSGVPFAHGARQASIESFNKDLGNRVLTHIGEKLPKNIDPGSEMNAYVNDRLSAAYNTIRPKIVGSTDKTYLDSFTALKATANTPEKKAMFKEITDAVKPFSDANGMYTGDGYKAASERLRALTQLWATNAENQGSVAARDMSRAAEQARKQMQFLIQRKTPDVGAQLKAVERGWAQKMRLEDASNRAMASGEGIASPGQYLTSLKKLDTSANKGASARGRTLDQPYAEAAAKVMGPGPATKLSAKETSIVAGALTGLGFSTGPVGPGVVAGIAAGLYGPGAKQIIQKILVGQRPSAIDNKILRRAVEDATRHYTTGD